MIAVPNNEQIKYTSVTIQEESVYKKLKLFFELRRDDESPFSVSEILDCYGNCASGKSFASRPGDIIGILSSVPSGKKASAMLRVRKAVGLYGLLSLVPGMVLEADKLDDDFDRVYYVINPQKDEKLLDRLARENITVSFVGTVVRNGYYIVRDNEIIEEVTAEPQEERHARIPRSESFSEGYRMGFLSAFEGKDVPCGDDIAKALGVLSARFDIRSDRSFNYNGASKGNALFLFTVSARGRNPDRRARLPFKRICSGMKKGIITDCVVFNNGDISAAKCRLSGEEYPEQPERFLREDVWYVLIASKGPIRGGYYMGRL